MWSFVWLLSLSAFSYVNHRKPLTHRITRASNAHKLCTCFQWVPSVSIKNIDCSEEGDFALLLLYSYGHIQLIGCELVRIERIDTEDLSAASVASVYAGVAVL